jgi:hypothetical protein
MANEITMSGSLSATKASVGLQVPSLSYSQSDDMAGTHAMSFVQDVGTTYEALAFTADMASVGWAIFENMDSTNYVEIGIEHSGTTFVAFLHIGPGKKCGPVRLAPAYNAIFARANTSAVKLRVTALER